MKKLRTVYPNSLNEIRKLDSEVPVGKLFFIVPKTKQRSARYRNNNDYLKEKNTMRVLFTNIHIIIENYIKTLSIKFAYYSITL